MAEERERAFFEGRTEYLIEDGLDFAYDPESGLFHLSGSGIPTTTEPDLDSLRAMLRSSKDGEQTGLIFTWLGMAETPNLRAQVREILEDPDRYLYTKTTVARVMKDVLKRTSAPHIQKVLEDSDEEISAGTDFMSYSVNLRPDGTFILNTFGNCACLGPDYASMVVTVRGGKDWSHQPDIPVGLTLHNNDLDSQTLSLLAGAGALAWIAQGRDSGQLDLGLIK